LVFTALGIRLATAGFAAGADEDELDELAEGELEDDLDLLLPHAAITPRHSSDSRTTNDLLHIRI
jgi:hypothetical protein